MKCEDRIISQNFQGVKIRRKEYDNMESIEEQEKPLGQ